MMRLFFALFFPLLMTQALFAQGRGGTLVELRGRLDETGTTLIQGLPVSKAQPDSVQQATKSINAVIGACKGKAIDVLNALAERGYKLVTALYISDTERRLSIDHQIIYYLRKE
jgi:hypothetical protein